MFQASNNRLFLTLTTITIVSILLSALLVKASITMSVAALFVVAICIITFTKPEIALYILVFSMLLSPEFGQRTTQGGGVTLRADDFLLVLICLSWFAKNALAKDMGMLRKTELNGPIFIYLGVCILSTAIGIQHGNVPMKSGFFFVLKYFEYYVVYFMVVNHIRSRQQIIFLIAALIITCIIVDIVAISQIPSGQRLSAPFEGERGEPNTLGGYLVLIMAVMASLLLTIQSIRCKLLLAMGIALSIVPFFMTQSRGSYLAFLPMYFMLLILSKKKLLLLTVLAVGILAAPILLPNQVVDRITYTFTQQNMAGQEKIGNIHLDTSTSARLRSWTEGIEGAMKRPLLGYGVTGWHFIDTQFIKVLVETGIFGFIAFVYILFSLYKNGLTIFRQTNDRLFKGISMGFLAGLTGMIVHSLSANTFIIVRIMEPFWLLAGIVMVIPAIESTAPDHLVENRMLRQSKAL